MLLRSFGAEPTCPEEVAWLKASKLLSHHDHQVDHTCQNHHNDQEQEEEQAEQRHLGGQGEHHSVGFPEGERSQQDPVLKVGLLQSHAADHHCDFVFRDDHFILKRRARDSVYADKSFYWQFKQVFFSSVAFLTLLCKYYAISQIEGLY